MEVSVYTKCTLDDIAVKLFISKSGLIMIFKNKNMKNTERIQKKLKEKELHCL